MCIHICKYRPFKGLQVHNFTDSYKLFETLVCVLLNSFVLNDACYSGSPPLHFQVDTEARVFSKIITTLCGVIS